jgi:hypothetical protein
MEIHQKCPECGALWPDRQTCQEHFHQMLFWEADHPDFGREVHHLMVLSYHLQHPSLYSPEGLIESRRLLTEFVERGASPAQILKRNRGRLNSNTRKWKIKGTPASRGSYARPVQWSMTAVDVTAGGLDHYCDNVRAWARSILEALKASGNDPAA